MVAALTADLGMPASAVRADEDWSDVVASVRRVLTATLSSADLISLELQVPGLPELGLLAVRRTADGVADLVLWPTVIGPGQWHDGVLLVAAAESGDAARRVAVHGAATLATDLIVAARRRRDAEVLASRAVELAGIDALTGLGNRRTWRQALDEEGARASRYDRTTTVVIADLDGLKRINDAHGHAAGDLHLQRAAGAVREAARSVDVVCRLGGDEFGILAPETGHEGAEHLAARLRSHLERAGVRASLGVASTSDGDLENAWHRADERMYAQKRSGTAGQV